jgi:Fe-Mn family superoxide dismutase
MAFALPELPYPKDALQPAISAETIEYHYGKHHQAYVDNLNNLTRRKPEANKTLEELICTAENGIFNNAVRFGTIPSTGTAFPLMAEAPRLVT